MQMQTQAIKLVVVGDKAAKKTDILIAYTTNKPPGEYVPTVMDNYSTNIQVDGKTINLGLWDTSGQEEYAKLRPLNYPQTDVFLVVFSVVHPWTLDNVISDWLPEVLQYCPNVPLVLVGTNIHKRTNKRTLDKLKNKGLEPISSAHGENIAKKMNAFAYRECSSRTMDGIKATFDTGVLAALTDTPLKPSMGPLHEYLIFEACKEGDIGTIINFIDEVPSVNSATGGRTMLDRAIHHNHSSIVQLLLLAGANPSPANKASKLQELILFWESVILSPRKSSDLSGRNIIHLPVKFFHSNLKNMDEIHLGNNKLSFFNTPTKLKATLVDLSKNNLSDFPNLGYMNYLKTLDLSYNKLEELPGDILKILPMLEVLDVSYNQLENIPSFFAKLKELRAVGNPLSSILPAYRKDNQKIVYYLQMSEDQAMLPWNQVKLMILGQEAVGKTTLLNTLQNEKYDPSVNISTNGIHISNLFLSSASSTLFGRRTTPKEHGVNYSVWDFGGQAVFHSTHRFFLTANAIYMVLYDISKLESYERLKYWVEQVGAVNDMEGTKPIIIVGTHADQISRAELAKRMQEIERIYPTISIGAKRSRSQIFGHFAVSLAKGASFGITELRAKLLELGLTHPKIGVGQVQVPRAFKMLQKEIEERKQKKPYLWWREYQEMANTMGIDEETLRGVTHMLHDTGLIVWNNVPRLKDLVMIDPQWLADAMAGVVTFICQVSVSKTGGMIDWAKMKASLTLRFPDANIHGTIVALLEFFEIVYKMRMGEYGMGKKSAGSTFTNEINDNQMFFVPTLLSPYDGKPHPAIQYWQYMELKHTYIRRFTWPSHPSGFFPRLLLRLVHLRMKPLACWIDAAVIMGKGGVECSFLHLFRQDNKFVLEARIKAQDLATEAEPLISELSYVIMRLHRDMNMLSTADDVPIAHEVVVHRKKVSGTEVDATVPFDDCIRAELQGKKFIQVEGMQERIEAIVPDLSGCKQFPEGSLKIDRKIGEGGFGVVFKGSITVKGEDNTDQQQVVAVKQMQINEDDQSAFYEFQHEILIMSKLRHQNLVQLYGITKAPFRMVMEFVPESDLHAILERNTKDLSMKWKIKVAIDIASGMRCLHSQSPPICHSDLRAPNVFIASLDKEADVVSKVADFGLSQQVFPFSQQALYNIMETAPETWEGGVYDEKSDVFSYAVILWRMFGSIAQNKGRVQSTDGKENGDVKGVIGRRAAAKSLGRVRGSIFLEMEQAKRQSIRDAKRFSKFVVNYTVRKSSAGKFAEEEIKQLKEQKKSGTSQPQDEDDVDEFAYLKEQGKYLPPPLQREAIRKGGRPPIHKDCPRVLAKIIQSCWQSTADSRPSFDIILDTLFAFYISKYSEDMYIINQIKRNQPVAPEETCFISEEPDLGELEETTVQVVKPWNTTPLVDIKEEGTVTSILDLGSEIWAGTSDGTLVMVDVKTSRVIQKLLMPMAVGTLSKTRTRKMAQLYVGQNCVWISAGTEVFVLSTKSRKIITSPLSNPFSITDMILLPDTNMVWVADTEGYVTIWDAQTLQKCYRFQVHTQNCVQTMVLLNNYVWMAVGRDIIVVHSKNLTRFQLENAHNDRVHHMLAVPQTNQVWTCTRDGAVCVWRLEAAARPLPTPKLSSSPASSPSLSSSPSSNFSASTSPASSAFSLSTSIAPSSSSLSSLTLSGALSINAHFSVKFSPNPVTPATHVIKAVHQGKTDTPVKSACLLAAESHVCTGTFDGSVILWNIQNFRQSNIPMPPAVKGHSVQCMLDTRKGMWCGIESSNNSLLYCQLRVHVTEKAQMGHKCYTHHRNHHDFFISYHVASCGAPSLLSPVKAIYDSLSGQKKRASNYPASVFWDVKCLNASDTWEKTFLHALSDCNVIILLLSEKGLEEIMQQAHKKQDNLLIEYECALLLNKVKGTRILPLLVGGVEKDPKTEKAVFKDFDMQALDSSKFPKTPHARRKEIQKVIDDLSKSVSIRDKDFLSNVAATIEQVSFLFLNNYININYI